MLNYGAMSGLSSFGFFLILFYLGWNPFGQISFLGFWIPIVFVCMATGNMRNNLLGGYITYGQAFRIGFLTASSAGFLYALLIYIFGTLIQPGLIDIHKLELAEGIEKTRAIFGEKFYESNLENVDKTTIFTMASGEFFSKSFGGFLISLITAGFYRRLKLYQEEEKTDHE